jgi:spore maturation protein CgeB
MWWKAVPNPNYYKSVLMEKFLKLFRHSAGKKNLPFIPIFARTIAKPKLEDEMIKLLSDKTTQIDAILMINVPLNQLVGLATSLKKYQKIPIIFYDVDVPTSLPSHGGFTFNHYVGANLSEYDSFIIPSEGSVQQLEELGAEDINVVHFGIDPSVYNPSKMVQDIDFFFFGNGGKSREKSVRMMISEPSKYLDYKFVVSGHDLNVDPGKSITLPPPSFIEWQTYCRRAKININAVRDLHANVFATSTSRPFELAAMKCCVVSSPYNGLDKWFDTTNEITVVNSVEECIEVYKTLINDEENRTVLAESAYQRVLKEHTTRHRARQIIDIIKKTDY